MPASAANTFLVYLDVHKLFLSTLHFCDFVNLDLSQAILLGLESRLFNRSGSIPVPCVVESPYVELWVIHRQHSEPCRFRFGTLDF